MKCSTSLIVALAAVLLVAPSARPQNCSGTSTGLVPLVDLGAGTWMGMTGGLYPGGQNARPPGHEAAGLAAASAVVPRDASGAPDPSGAIVLLSVGMSNTTQEFQRFIQVSNADPLRNPSVVVVDGAQGGWDAQDIADPAAQYWTNVDQRLAQSGVTPQQVQVVWLKQALRQPSGPFPVSENLLRGFLGTVVQIVKQRYPNAGICYLSSRIYAGYAVTTLNPEPWAYQSGFAVRWLVEDQISGDPALNHDPAAGPVQAPWLAWGPYLWADGLVPRSDGLIWECSDFAPDGTHPGPGAREKVAAMLSAHLHSDSTATGWYEGGGPPPGTPAFRMRYGAGCPGTQGVPHIVSNSTPYLGNANFNLGVAGAAPASPATLLLSLAPDALSVGPCAVLVSLDPAALVWPAPGMPSTLVTNGAGNGFFHLVIPPDPALDQLDVFAQWVVVDPLGLPVGGTPIALSRGMLLHIGPQG